MSLQRGRVLVAEPQDDAQHTELLLHCLRKEGFAPLAVHSALELVEALSTRIDATVLDLELAGLRTPAVLNALRASRSRSVLVLTSHAPGTEEPAYDLDPDAWLAKPLDVGELVHTVRCAMEGLRLARHALFAPATLFGAHEGLS